MLERRIAPDLKPRQTAIDELVAIGVTTEQMEKITGFGLRHGCHCKPDDTILNKYQAGALSASGVMCELYGLDSPQHHAGTALNRRWKIMTADKKVLYATVHAVTEEDALVKGKAYGNVFDGGICAELE